MKDDFSACSNQELQLEAGERVLYHCLYREPEGDALLATCEREVNGRTGKFLFAATHLTKALAFAFSYHDAEIGGNGALTGTEDEFAIICNRSQTLNAPRHARVFSFSSAGFEQMGSEDARQYVSTKPMPFKDTQLVFEARDVNDLMRAGLQIFSTEETADEFSEGASERALKDIDSIEEWLCNLVRDEGLIWENDVRFINPNAALKKMMAVSAPAPTPVMPPASKPTP